MTSIFVFDFYKRCRLCTFIVENFLPLESDLLNRIKLLFQLKIVPDDSLPKNICLNCSNSVNIAWSFFEKITNAQRELYEMTLKIKSHSDSVQKSIEEPKMAKVNNTVIFNEISIIPINTHEVSTGNRDIYENYSRHSNVNRNTKNMVNGKCTLFSKGSLVPLNDYSYTSEISSDTSTLVNQSSESFKIIPKSSGGILKRKQKLKATKIATCHQLIQNKLSEKLIKDKVCFTYNRTKIRKRSQVSIKELTKDYHLDPSDVWPDYPWNCNVCSAKCTDINDYRKHPCFQIHKRFFCADCPKTLVQAQQFFQHVSEVHWERLQKHLLLQCHECQLWFPSPQAQEEHIRAEHPDVLPRLPLPEIPFKNLYKCDQCDKDCKTRSQLTNHLKLHSKDKSHVCDVCSKAYFYPSSLLEHRKLHNKSRDFICEQCGRGFYNKGTLKAHKQTHLNINDRELPFTCSFCNKRFANRCKLRYHEMVHTGAKPFICDICGRNFRLRDSLKGHITIVHSEEKTHSCSCCDMKFKTATNLSAHMRQHTGEHPYACTECSKTFSNYSNCDKHMKRIHNLTLKGRVNLAKMYATVHKELEDI